MSFEGTDCVLYVCSVVQALEELYMSENELSAEGLKYIIDALRSTKVSMMYAIYEYNLYL